MPFGRIKADNQLFFLNTAKVFGVQSYSIDNTLGAYTIKYLGMGSEILNESFNSAQYADLSLTALMIYDDLIIPQATAPPFNVFILNNKNDTAPYSLVSGYISSYSAQFSPNQIPQINTSFRFYNNAGNIATGNLDPNSIAQLSTISNSPIPAFNNQLANSNYINLSINESTGNRVLDFNFGISVDRVPIYNIGSRVPKRVDIVFPINVTCDIKFEADNSFINSPLSDFPQNKNVQNLEVDVYSNLSNSPMGKYQFVNMTMISNNQQINVDGNLTVTRKYRGYIYNYTDASATASAFLDFGFVASGPGFYYDWGSVALTATSGIDWGNS